MYRKKKALSIVPAKKGIATVRLSECKSRTADRRKKTKARRKKASQRAKKTTTSGSKRKRSRRNIGGKKKTAKRRKRKRDKNDIEDEEEEEKEEEEDGEETEESYSTDSDISIALPGEVCRDCSRGKVEQLDEQAKRNVPDLPTLFPPPGNPPGRPQK